MRWPFSHSCLSVYKKRRFPPHRPSLVALPHQRRAAGKKRSRCLALLWRIWPCVRGGAFLPGRARFPWCAWWKGSHRSCWWQTEGTGKAAGTERRMMEFFLKKLQRWGWGGGKESGWTACVSVEEVQKTLSPTKKEEEGKKKKRSLGTSLFSVPNTQFSDYSVTF